jgi:hypothetical protein
VNAIRVRPTRPADAVTSKPQNADAHAFYASIGATSENVRAHALFGDAFGQLAADAS